MNKVTELQIHQEKSIIKTNLLSSEQVLILKNSLYSGLTDDEFKIFLMACNKTQLDPFMKQIYAIKREQKQKDGSYKQVMMIQAGIDGYRLIAERTGLYAPGPEPTFTYTNEGNLLSATAYIKKQTKDGTWHMISSCAFIDEYMQSYTDRKTGEKKPSGIWGTMPRTMLAKCAESQALRKAFPAELSGVYTKEEMEQAEKEKIDLEQVTELASLIELCDEEYRNTIYEGMKKNSISDLCDLSSDIYAKIKKACLKRIEKNEEKQKEIEITPITENAE